MSKSFIKSKKEKLRDKKRNKYNHSQSSFINLTDSPQSQHSQEYIPEQNIQKRSKYSGQSLNAANPSKPSDQITRARVVPPNQINFQRLKKDKNKSLNSDSINLLQPKPIENESTLMVVEDVGPEPQIKSTANERSLFSYKVLGKDGIKYISESYYKGRINSQIEAIEQKEAQKQLKGLKNIQKETESVDEEGIVFTNKPKQSNTSNKQQSTVLEPNIEKGDTNLQLQSQKSKGPDQIEAEPPQAEPKPVRRVTPRYFIQNFEDSDSDNINDEERQIVKCYRCNQKGHIAKNCPEEALPIKCNYCLREHHYNMCASSPCFRCCETGHISQDCPSKAIECRRCHKRGHKSDSCQVPLFLNYHNRSPSEIKQNYRAKDLKLLKCMNPDCKSKQGPNDCGRGHFNCFVYGSYTGPQPYEEFMDKKELLSMKRGFNNDNVLSQSFDQGFNNTMRRERDHHGNRNNAYRGYDRYDRYDSQHNQSANRSSSRNDRNDFMGNRLYRSGDNLSAEHSDRRNSGNSNHDHHHRGRERDRNSQNNDHRGHNRHHNRHDDHSNSHSHRNSQSHHRNNDSHSSSRNDRSGNISNSNKNSGNKFFTKRK